MKDRDSYLRSINALKKALARVSEGERRFRELAELLPEIVYEMDTTGRFTYVNQKAFAQFGYDPADFDAGANALDMIIPDDHQRAIENMARIMDGQRVYHNEYTCLRKDGSTFPGMFYSAVRRQGQEVVGILGIIIDITGHHLAEMALKKARDDLEARVASRTRELHEANRSLMAVVREKIKTARALKQREAELELKTGKLEDMNTALRYLLNKIDREKTVVEEKMMADLRDLVHPYVKKLAKRSHDREVRALVTILENHLKAIVAPFSRYLSSPAIGLSPAELNIAHMVRDGKRTKEIAAILNLSYKTVETHRVNIRKKLGLTGKGINLRTCLIAMENPVRGLQKFQKLRTNRPTGQ